MEHAQLCKSGLEIKTEEECRDALGYAEDLGIKLGAREYLKTGSWGHVPYQCSYQAGGDQAFHFNREETSNVYSFCSGFYKMICKQGNTFQQSINTVIKSI